RPRTTSTEIAPTSVVPRRARIRYVLRVMKLVLSKLHVASNCPAVVLVVSVPAPAAGVVANCATSAPVHALAVYAQISTRVTPDASNVDGFALPAPRGASHVSAPAGSSVR